MHYQKSLRHKRRPLRVAHGTGWLIPAVTAMVAVSAVATWLHT